MRIFPSKQFLTQAGLALAGMNLAFAGSATNYAVVVSEITLDQPAWRQVVETLERKHSGFRIVFRSSVEASLAELRSQFPRYACFVAQPEEVSREFVAKAHRMTRDLDSDPYADLFWGILTGYDAESALAIAQTQTPLTVRKVAAGTDVALEMCEEGVWYSELEQGKMVRKEPGQAVKKSLGPSDTTQALAATLNDYQADLFVTSGHATERDWMIGFSYKNGFFKHEKGQLYGLDTKGQKHLIQSPNPKVYLPVGNCLMGHIDQPDCMALAWMMSAGVRQMIGYTVPTWYGYAGWGCLDYFVEQPGRFTFTEAFFANQAALIQKLETGSASSTSTPTQRRQQSPQAAGQTGLSPNDRRGLLFDRDVVAFYGDPAWEATMAAQPCAWTQTLSQDNNVYTFEILPQRGQRSFEPININGSQRGWRPIIQLLPQRIQNIRVLEGDALRPVITDNFILVPNPRVCDADKTYRIRFYGESVKNH